MNDLKKTMMAAGCLVLSVVPMTAQTRTGKAMVVSAAAHAAAVSDARPTAADTRPTMADTRRTAAPESLVPRRIVVSLEDRRLALVEDGVVKKVYRVAVGKAATPSPTGTFTIADRVENPTYYHAGEVIPPGPANPVGTRWIGLDRKGYGIHGTNVPRSIGKAASHGCIRMRRRDLDDLFAQVRNGDEVEIVGERNEETAAIFGTGAGSPLAAPVQAQMLTVQAATETSAPNPTAEAAAGAAVPAVAPANR